MTTPVPTKPQIPTLGIGDRVRFTHPVGGGRRWWTVRATDDRYTILTRQADFAAKGVSVYTIIDRARDVRGPCNLIGQGWDSDDPGGCEALLQALQRTALSADEMNRLRDEWKKDPESEYPCAVEVSYRNNVPVEIGEIRHV